jgi:hypothetical protein
MTDRPMCPTEFAELQQIAGYPFISDEHAQKFRLRLLKWQEIEHMLAGPHVEARRVDRD